MGCKARVAPCRDGGWRRHLPLSSAAVSQPIVSLIVAAMASLARVLRLVARSGLLAAGPQPSALPALAALQSAGLPGLLTHLQPPARHWRGFAAAPPGSSGGGGGGGGDGTKVASTEQAGQQLADEPQQRHEQQDQKKEEKQADAAAKATADEAASSAADGAAGQGQPGGDGSADQAGSTQAPPSWTIDKDNPELQKYIQQLKQLKGEAGSRDNRDSAVAAVAGRRFLFFLFCCGDSSRAKQVVVAAQA